MKGACDTTLARGRYMEHLVRWLRLMKFRYRIAVEKKAMKLIWRGGYLQRVSVLLHITHYLTPCRWVSPREVFIFTSVTMKEHP